MVEALAGDVCKSEVFGFVVPEFNRDTHDQFLIFESVFRPKRLEIMSSADNLKLDVNMSSIKLPLQSDLDKNQSPWSNNPIGAVEAAR